MGLIHASSNNRNVKKASLMWNKWDMGLCLDFGVSHVEPPHGLKIWSGVRDLP